MTKATKENLENQSSSQKNPTTRLKAGSGVIIFLSVCSVLTFGFCKFSFYLLKNHRSAVDRPELTRSYADIRPFGEQEKIAAPNIFYTPEKNEKTAIEETTAFKAPIVFEPIEKQNEAILAKEVVSETPVPTLTAETQNDKNVQNALIDAYRSAPTTSLAIKTSFEKNDVQNETASVVLDDLIVSGTVLLEQTDEQLTKSASLLEEQTNQDTVFLKEDLSSDKKDNIIQATSTQQDNNKEEKSLPFEQTKPTENKKQATHWVDIEALRAEIARQKNSSNEIKIEETQYVSAKQMPDNQTASLPDASISDAPAVVSEVPVDGTQSATVEQKDAVSEKEQISENVVVSSLEKEETAKKSKSLASKKDKKEQKLAKKEKKKKRRKSPWKIAKVNGQSIDNLAVNTYSASEKKEDVFKEKASENVLISKTDSLSESLTSGEDDISLAEAENPAEKPSTVIYRNGKIKQVINADGTQTDFQPQTAYREKQNLEWLEGQEAAVWTNISQSDVPSVWSFASNQTENSDRAKAFKTSAQESAPPIMATEDDVPPLPPAPPPSSPTTTGKENTPPAAAQPTTPTLQPAPQPPAPTAAPVTQKKEDAPVLALPTVKPLTIQKPKTAEKTQEALLGKMGPDDAPPSDGGSFAGKLLSLFSKEGEASSGLPSVGAGTAAGVLAGKANNSSDKGKSAKNTSQKSMAALLKNLSVEKKQEENRILPDEIRLTFKDGNSDLSASSVSLIKRFAQHANKDIQSVIEVRVSEQFPEIQQQRFAIIRNILIGSNVEDSQILLYQSSRPPNTLILRTYIVSDEEYESSTSWLNGVEERLYYKKW